ncbi:DNA/RNA nuclease SfsA [Desulfosoma caldarium]|uniref:Sugar fermentation stimulation protein homolog n=1 Tax=Desulfosoma caldarium TaxID=610254 RepID=A0A3N1VQ67_9BACT|nr:DNA/RNA nuclease SfsA [Desulfosoma caldarium]ROR03211.1 sugar fermentation stimulation protein A [Desulfosoma caldarium]
MPDIPLQSVSLSFNGLGGAGLIPAVFLKRPNRFTAEMLMADGRRETVHCPNSGSMKGCLKVGASVRLSEASPRRGRKTAYTWEMIEIDGVWVGINTAVPNHLAAQAAEKRALPIFTDALAVRREVPAGNHSRIDLRVETPAGALWVEVKNVTLVENGTAFFPDAVTTRGTKHLEVLVEKVRAGDRAAMLYVVQRMDADRFAPADHIDPVYGRRFRWAQTQGVAVCVVQARVSPEAIVLERLLSSS